MSYVSGLVHKNSTYWIPSDGIIMATAFNARLDTKILQGFWKLTIIIYEQKN